MVQNVAIPIMTETCPPENECELTIDDISITPAAGENPAYSTYEYRCTDCGSEWTVHWPQVQPTFDRNGNIISTPEPIVVPK